MMIEASSNNHHQIKDNKVEQKRSKRAKMTKIFVPNFLPYLLKNQP
jgi:hypothetical protein